MVFSRMLNAAKSPLKILSRPLNTMRVFLNSVQQDVEYSEKPLEVLSRPLNTMRVSLNGIQQDVECSERLFKGVAADH
jgi:hypothetical protein